jgi:hypothetical protein
MLFDKTKKLLLLLSSTAMNDSSKRPIDPPVEEIEDDDGMKRPAKRARFEKEEASRVPIVLAPQNAADTFIPTMTTPRGHRFLRLHLQLLKAIYFQERKETKTTTEESDSVSGQEQDGPIDEELCQTIERFLRDRGRVRALDAKVQHYEGLYEDAVDFIREEDEEIDGTSGAAKLSMSPWSLLTTPQGNATNGGRSRAGNFLYGATARSTSSMLFGGSQQSPFVSAIYPHSLLSSHHHHEQGSHNSAGGENTSANPFGLVAGLLQAKFHALMGDLQQTTAPFEPLVAQVGQRIERLEKLASDHDRLLQGEPAFVVQNDGDDLADSDGKGKHDATGPSDEQERLQSWSSEDREEWLAQVEIKLRLWRLLHSDLVNQ